MLNVISREKLLLTQLTMLCQFILTLGFVKKGPAVNRDGIVVSPVLLKNFER